MSQKIGCLFIAAVAFLFLGCTTDPRANWPQPRVNLDKLGLTKTLIADCCFRGDVRSIQLGNFDGDSELEIAVVAQTGIYLFEATTLRQKAKLDYKKADGDTLWFGLSPFLIQDKGGFNIAKLGGGFGDVGLLDRAGKELWKFKANPNLPPHGMVVDDSVLGKPWFYVCDSGPVYKLDADGKIVWKISAGALYITLVRDGDGVVSGFATADDSSGILNIWSVDGKREEQIKLPFRPDGLEFVRSEETSGFVVKSGRQIAFIDRTGKQLFTHGYGSVPIYHGPSAALVRLFPKQPPLLAVRFTSRSAIGKSVLSLFSLDGTPVYEEYLDGGAALGVVPVKNEDREKLLVGDGTTKLWAYEGGPGSK